MISQENNNIQAALSQPAAQQTCRQNTACAHLSVGRLRTLDQRERIVREWWECADCHTEFRPVSRNSGILGGQALNALHGDLVGPGGRY